jgi:DNA polymerase-3 subunit gamma/tau
MQQQKNEKVLSVANRPKTLDSFIGNESLKKLIKSQFESNRVPQFYILSGPPGSGKTTIARIIANMLKGSVTEMNAADKNGIDDIRSIIDNSNFKPIGYNSKVFIFDEAHQLTNQAQNTLLKITEEPPDYVYFIFCTTNDSKIIAALKRRACILTTSTLNREAITSLINDTVLIYDDVAEKEKMKSFIDLLCEYNIDTPGLVLQALEKYLAGLEPIECIFSTNAQNIETLKLCSLVSKGSWKQVSAMVKDIKKEDLVMVRSCILGYLKSILLKDSSRAVTLSKAIKIIGEDTYELPIFLANLCLGCSLIGQSNGS